MQTLIGYQRDVATTGDRSESNVDSNTGPDVDDGNIFQQPISQFEDVNDASVATNLPSDPLPTEGALVAWYGQEDAAEQASSARINANNAALAKLHPYGTLSASLRPYAMAYYHNVVQQLDIARTEGPKLRNEYRQMSTAFDDLSTYNSDFENAWFPDLPAYTGDVDPAQYQSDCNSYWDSGSPRWLIHAAGYHNAAGAWWHDYATLATGIISRIADPDARQYQLLLLRNEAENLSVDLGRDYSTRNFASKANAFPCSNVQTTSSTAPDPAAVDLSPTACGPVAQGFAFDFSLAGLLSVSINCDGVSLAASDGPVGVFASATFSFSSEVSIFAGAQASISGPGPLPLSAGFQQGVYITVDKNGLQDAGLKFTGGLSAQTSLGPVSYTAGHGVEGVLSIVASSKSLVRLQ